MRKAVYLLLGLAVLVLAAVVAGADFLADWLWFRSLGAAAVFWTAFLTGWGVRLASFGVALLFFLANFGLAFRAFTRLRRPEEDLLVRMGLHPSVLAWLNIAGSAILALFVSAAFNPGWTAVQQFLHPVAAGARDPVFHRDIGYYLFRFPIWRSLNGLLQSLVWLTLLGTGAIYWLARAFWRQGDRYVLWPQAKTHLTILAVLLFTIKIWGYSLARQGLLFTDNGLITGIDYTAVAVRLPVYNLLGIIAALCAALLIAGLFRRGFRLFLAGVAALLVSSFVLGTVAPGVVRSFVVRPNEFTLERPYIRRHIDHTRKAFGLDRFKVSDYRFGREETDLRPDSPTLANLRLWDFRPLKQTYEQLQTMRPYYTFNEIDIDRYTIGGRQRQVMLAARELDVAELPAGARNWTNLHLAYTHGYGIALNGVNQVNEEGQPVFLVGNLPPRVAPEAGLTLDRPQIYFGETLNDYIVAPNGYGEFDYPTGSGEKRTNYAGRDGVSLRSVWTRALFALRYGDLNFLLSNYVEPGRSKVIFHRRVADRVSRLAPFLAFDQDPYIVAAGGRLYWIIDAYTTSSHYPYAARHQTGVNYMRNAVKAVVDAYDGSVTFYVADPSDPIVRVWQRVFPQLLTPLDRLPGALRAHLRYPEGFFRVQRDMLLVYHMTDSRTFFRKEDAWAIPTETHGGGEEEVLPYYVTARLPGEAEAEFILMQPLKPAAARRTNMVAWMAARNDGGRYGEVLVYLLPKDRVIYGPIQVQGRIAQNAEISKLHTLWGQQQSTVIRGNLLVLPFAGDFLYVEPTFIVSNQGRQPELRLVVLAYKDRIVFGSTLPEAVAQLLGTAPPPDTAGAPGPAETRPDLENRDATRRLIQQLLQSIRAQQDEIRRQQRVLEELQDMMGR